MHTKINKDPKNMNSEAVFVEHTYFKNNRFSLVLEQDSSGDNPEERICMTHDQGEELFKVLLSIYGTDSAKVLYGSSDIK